jgi:hypothetical protein
MIEAKRAVCIEALVPETGVSKTIHTQRRQALEQPCAPPIPRGKQDLQIGRITSHPSVLS